MKIECFLNTFFNSVYYDKQNCVNDMINYHLHNIEKLKTSGFEIGALRFESNLIKNHIKTVYEVTLIHKRLPNSFFGTFIGFVDENGFLLGIGTRLNPPISNWEKTWRIKYNEK